MRSLALVISIGGAVLAAGAGPVLAQSESAESALQQRVSRIIDRTEPPANSKRLHRRIGPSESAADDAELPADTRQPWLLNTLTALGVVIGLILLLRWVWSRLGGRVSAGHSPVVELLSRTTVAPKNHVVLIRVGERVLVCSDSPSGLRTLADVQDPQQVADLLGAISATRQGSMTRGFNQLLGRFHREHDRTQTPDGDREVQVDRARDSVSGLLSQIRTLAGKRGAA